MSMTSVVQRTYSGYSMGFGIWSMGLVILCANIFLIFAVLNLTKGLIAWRVLLNQTLIRTVNPIL